MECCSKEEYKNSAKDLISQVEKFIDTKEAYKFSPLHVRDVYTYLGVARIFCAKSNMTIDEKINFNQRLYIKKMLLDSQVSSPPPAEEICASHERQIREMRVSRESLSEPIFSPIISYEEDMRDIEKDLCWWDEHGHIFEEDGL